MSKFSVYVFGGKKSRLPVPSQFELGQKSNIDHLKLTTRAKGFAIIKGKASFVHVFSRELQSYRQENWYKK